MKCYFCEYCYMVSERGTEYETYAEARCKLKKGKKKGRIITWSFPTYKTTDGLLKGIPDIYASEKVLKVIARRKPPAWCDVREN